MIKLMFKNLWNRRGKHTWLFLELIVVTVLAWEFMDAPIVQISDLRMPLGYDSDRLVMIQLNTLPESSPDFKPEENDSLSRINNVHTLLTKARALDGVENATATEAYRYVNSSSRINTGYRSSNLKDSLYKTVTAIDFWPGVAFFETYGIKTLPGEKSPEELSNVTDGRFGLIITKDYASLFGPEYGRTGKDLISVYDNSDGNIDTTYYHIVGVIENVRPSSYDRTNCQVFYSTRFEPGKEFNCVVRLKPGVNADEFVASLDGNNCRSLKTGNYYVEAVRTYSDLIHAIEDEQEITAKRHKGFIMTIFFLASLILGVIGSFYLQTKRRIQEIGIHRSFGARRSDIVRLMMGEAAILATIAFIIGDIIYLNLTLHTGFAYGTQSPDSASTIQNWVSDYKTHFAFLSAVVYLLIISSVCLGTWLPARSASRVNPVDALRDE